MLGDADVGLFLVFRVLREPYEVRTMDENDHVGILLDGSGFTKVAELGLSGAASALHGISGKLGQGDDRDVQFLGRGLQRAGNGCHFLFAEAAEFGGSLH